MRGLGVHIIGVVAILGAVAGLSLDAFRMGPIEKPLAPAVSEGEASGTYVSRADTRLPLGVCPAAPCDPATEIDLRFHGLPKAPYEARLEGTGGAAALGPLAMDGAEHVLVWRAAEDHTDKTSVVLTVAGHDVAAVPVRASPTPARVAERIEAAWGPLAGLDQGRDAAVHLNEIGGVTISAVAIVELPLVPPGGWQLHAWFEGIHGIVDLGALQTDGDDGVSVLDGRVERVRLEDQHRFVVAMAPEGWLAGDGFPVTVAALGPHG